MLTACTCATMMIAKETDIMASKVTFGTAHPQGSYRDKLPPSKHEISEATAGENRIPNPRNNPPQAHTEVDSEADLGDPMGD